MAVVEELKRRKSEGETMVYVGDDTLDSLREAADRSAAGEEQAVESVAPEIAAVPPARAVPAIPAVAEPPQPQPRRTQISMNIGNVPSEPS